MDKINTIVLTTLFLLVGCAASDKATLSLNKKDDILIIINENWTIDSLNNTQNILKRKGIDFQYSGLKFKSGKIDSLSIKVNTNDGYKGSASTSESNLKDNFGFFRNYDKKFKHQFAIGYFGKMYNIKN